MLKNYRYPAYYDASIDDESLDPELASLKSDGLMSKEDKAKLDSIIVKDDGTPSEPVDASTIITDPEHQFVTEKQIEKLDNLVIMDYDETQEALVLSFNK